MKTDGSPQADIDQQAKDMAKFSEMYKNPLFNALISYTEILPVGLIVTLISAAILKRKKTLKYFHRQQPINPYICWSLS